MITNEEIREVYQRLKNRQEDPRGDFDKAGRWFSDFPELVKGIRYPSRAWPYSQLIHCRTLKFVKRLAEKAENFEELKCLAYK